MRILRCDAMSIPAASQRARVFALLCFLCVAAAAPSPVRAQGVRVTREQLLTRFPAAAQRAVATVTRAGIDSLRFDRGAITLGPDRFLTLATGEPLAVVPDVLSDSPSQLSGDRLVLPYRYVTADARGEDLWVLRPVFQAQGPIHFDDGLFRGTFYLALEDSAHPRESRPLRVPIRLNVLAGRGTLAPAALTFDSTNFPLKQVHLVADRVGDSVRVRIIPEFDLRGTDVWLPVEPSLVIETSPRRIQGLGIESAPLIVAIRGGRLQKDVTVDFDADRGSFEPSSVVLTPDDQTASVRVRSAGLGPASLRAFTDGRGQDSVVFTFTFPWPFLLTALLGGLTGGLGAWVMGKDGKVPDLRRALVRGLVLGLLAAVVYYALGINLLRVDVEMERFNEAAVFAFAALAALLGLRLRTARAPAP